METHVLMPQEFMLKVNPQSKSPSIAKLLEQQVSLVSTIDLPKGVLISPAQGSVRCGKLDIYSTLPENNICYDEIIKTPPETEVTSSSKIRRVRRCNWTRFLTYDDQQQGSCRANLKCTQVNGQVHYQVLEKIKSNTDLVLDSSSTKQSSYNDMTTVKSIAALMQELPLDLSQPLLYPMPNTAIAAPMSPLFTLEDRSSVISSDSGLSSSEETDVVVKAAEPPSPPSTPKQPTTVAGRKTASSRSRNSGKKMLPCSFCGKCFDRPSLLNRHLRTHTGERPHVCDICEKGFSTSSSLNTHRRIHSGEKPHECTTCGKRFTASSNLYYHRMTHVKEKPHKCELCQKSFPTPGDLKSHMYIHNGSWPHRCHICDRGFSKVTNLKNHLFLHTGQKPHECHKCGKRFALGCNMKAHLKTHDPNRPSSKSLNPALDPDEDEESMLNVID